MSVALALALLAAVVSIVLALVPPVGTRFRAASRCAAGCFAAFVSSWLCCVGVQVNHASGLRAACDSAISDTQAALLSNSLLGAASVSALACVSVLAFVFVFGTVGLVWLLVARTREARSALLVALVAATPLFIALLSIAPLGMRASSVALHAMGAMASTPPAERADVLHTAAAQTLELLTSTHVQLILGVLVSLPAALWAAARIRAYGFQAVRAHVIGASLFAAGGVLALVLSHSAHGH